MVKLEKRSDSCNTRSISNCVEETQRLNVYFETALGRAKPQTANKIDKRSYKNSRLKSFLTVTLGKKLSAQSLYVFQLETRLNAKYPDFLIFAVDFRRSIDHREKAVNNVSSRYFLWRPSLSLSISVSLRHFIDPRYARRAAPRRRIRAKYFVSSWQNFP